MPGATFAVVDVAAGVHRGVRRAPLPFSRARFLLAHVAVVAPVLAGLETYAWLRSLIPTCARKDEKRAGTRPPRPRRHLPVNGWSPIDATTATSASRGLPTSASPASSRATIALAGRASLRLSFAAGYGVDDTDAMPSRLGRSRPIAARLQLRNGRLRPHQMLSALEYGVVAEASSPRGGLGVDQAIPDHVPLRRLRRVGPLCPRYVVDAGGRAVRHGRVLRAPESRGISQSLTA